MSMDCFAVQFVVLQDAVKETLSRGLVVEVITPERKDVGSADINAAINQILPDLEFVMLFQNIRVQSN
jgi:hypothetical protein